MRHIVLDTETTGLSVEKGHRIVEIGAIEMMNLSPTGEVLHLYINPECEIEEGAQRVHGLSSEFLADKPIFADIVTDFMAFIGDDPLVIHNAPFDIGFLNAELARCDHPPLSMDRVIDTLDMAREKFPGAQASLDALCRRFAVDNAHRNLHGALIDADLLASVYIELLGGRQPGLEFSEATTQSKTLQNGAQEENFSRASSAADRPMRPARQFAVPKQEAEDHKKLIDRIKDAIWRR